MTDISQAVTLAFIAGPIMAAFSMLGIWLQGRQGNKAKADEKKADAVIRAAEKQAEYDRQDELAARAEAAAKKVEDGIVASAARATETARLLVISNAEVAAITKETGDKMALAAQVQNGKLDVLHTLTDGHYTAAKQSELDATTRELAMMHQVASMTKNGNGGQIPGPSLVAAITATEAKIIELRAELDERHKQAKLVQTQQENQRKELGGQPPTLAPAPVLTDAAEPLKVEIVNLPTGET